MIHMGFSFIVVCSCTFEVIVQGWKTRCVFSAMQQLANCEGVCVTNSPTNLNDRWRNSMTSSNRSKNTYLVGYSSVFYLFKIPVYLSEKMKHVTYLSSLLDFPRKISISLEQKEIQCILSSCRLWSCKELKGHKAFIAAFQGAFLTFDQLKWKMDVSPIVTLNKMCHDIMNSTEPWGER